MLIDGWKISDLPQRATSEDYEYARLEVIESFKNVEGVEAIMDFGTEPYPGISDIDFYIVFSPKAEHIYLPKAKPYSPMTRYLMTHTVLLVSDEFLPSLRYLNPWSRFAKERYIWQTAGYTPKVAEELAGDTAVSSASFMLDKLDAMFAYLPYFKNKVLPVRHILEVCKNAVYCIWRLEDSGIKPRQEYLDFVKRFNNTRDNWFALDEKEAAGLTIGYFTEVMNIAFAIAWDLAEWLDTRIFAVPVSETGLKMTRKTKWDEKYKSIYCHTFKYSRMYTQAPLTPEEAFALSLQASERVQVSIPGFKREHTITPTILPWNLAAFLVTTAVEKGILSDEVKKDIWVAANDAPLLKDELLIKKVQIQNQLTKEYKEKRKPGGSGKGYIYGNQVFGYLFNEETLLRKLFVRMLRKKFFINLNKVYTKKYHD